MKFLTDLTLGKRIAFLTTLGLILAVAAFSILAMRAVNQATDTMLEDRLTTAKLLAGYLDETLGRALKELKDTADLLSSDGSSPDNDIQALEETYHKLSIHIDGIYLLNKQREIVWSRPELTGSKDMYYYPSVSQSIAEGRANISGAVLAPGTGNPAVLLTAPTSQGGALVATVNLALSSIGGFVQPVSLGQTGYVEVVDQNGIVIIRTQPGPRLESFEKSDHSGRFAELIAAGKPTRGLCHTCHDPVEKVKEKDMLAFVPLTQTKWGVVIRQSEDEALAPIRELGWNLLFFGAGLIVVALLFVAGTTRDVVSRIRMLTAASKRIALGDLTMRVPTSRKDEIGVLATTFEDMRLRLRNSYGELERRTEELVSLLSVSEILTSLSDLSNLDNALGAALDKTLEIMKTDTGGILLLDDEERVLRYRVYRGLSERYVQAISLSPGEGIAGRVVESGQAICVEDAPGDPRTASPDVVNAEGLRAFASVPLRSKDRVLGVLNIASRGARKFTPENVRLLEGIAGQIATAIENARLHQEVQRKDEVRGELLRQILSIQEEERKRIARELHDETCQVLASLTANLEAASVMLPANSDTVKGRLKAAQSLSVSALDEIHRLIYQLRPSLLDDLGLVTAARWLAENNLNPLGIKVNFTTLGRVKRLAPDLETTLFRVIQEAVSNIARHASARDADIALHFKRGAIEVHVSDDGCGFDVKEAIGSKERPRGLGLLGMKERVELMNGTLKINSRPGGSGTKIDIRIPINQETGNGKDKDTSG